MLFAFPVDMLLVAMVLVDSSISELVLVPWFHQLYQKAEYSLKRPLLPAQLQHVACIVECVTCTGFFMHC